MKPPFKLGDKVLVSAVLEKRQIYTDGKGTETMFTTESIPDVKGIYIGYRTAQTGITRYFNDDGPEFKPTGKVLYLLVVTNERQNPIKAHPQFTL